MRSAANMAGRGVYGAAGPGEAQSAGLPGELTRRDLEIEAWLDRLAGAGLTQIQARFGLGKSQAYRRLQVLRQHQLVSSLRLLANRPSLFVVAGRSLRPASVEHALLAARLVAERERLGIRVVTEIELRRERAGQPALPSWLGGVERQAAGGSPTRLSSSPPAACAPSRLSSARRVRPAARRCSATTQLPGTSKSHGWSPTVSSRP